MNCPTCGNPTNRLTDGRGTYLWVTDGYDPNVFKPTECLRCWEKTRRREAAKRRRETPNVAAGVDILRAFEAYRKHPPFVGNLGHVKIEVGHRSSGSYSGRAWTRRRRMRVAFGPGATKAAVLEVLVHEMCHLACPPREAHGERFRLTLRRAARELWGIEVPLLSGKNRAEEKNAAYKMDRLIMAELEARVAAGAVETFDFVAPEKSSRAERNNKLVEKRAAHAVKMLAQYERKLKLVRTLHRKWKAKVQRYERIAAKKGST